MSAGPRDPGCGLEGCIERVAVKFDEDLGNNINMDAYLEIHQQSYTRKKKIIMRFHNVIKNYH